MDNSNEDEIDGAGDAKARSSLTSDEKLANEKWSEESWDVARLKGWHKTDWKDRDANGPPEPKAEPWYVWAIIAVVVIGILLPWFVWL